MDSERKKIATTGKSKYEKKMAIMILIILSFGCKQKLSSLQSKTSK